RRTGSSSPGIRTTADPPRPGRAKQRANAGRTSRALVSRSKVTGLHLVVKAGSGQHQPRTQAGSITVSDGDGAIAVAASGSGWRCRSPAGDALGPQWLDEYL